MWIEDVMQMVMRMPLRMSHKREDVMRMLGGCQVHVTRMSCRCNLDVMKGCHADIRYHEDIIHEYETCESRMSRRCQEDVKRVSRGCQEDVTRMSPGCHAERQV